MMAAEGTYKAYFRGNGANVIKNVPETALKLTCNDRVKALIAQDGHTVSFGACFLHKHVACTMINSCLSASLRMHHHLAQIQPVC